MTATMVIGFDESIEERLEHLERTRQFQDETGGLASLLCWTFKPYFTQIFGIEISTGGVSAAPLAVPDLLRQYSAHSHLGVDAEPAGAGGVELRGVTTSTSPIEDEVTQKAGATISLNFRTDIELRARIWLRGGVPA